jgi:hypothetical protein
MTPFAPETARFAADVRAYAATIATLITRVDAAVHTPVPESS